MAGPPKMEHPRRRPLRLRGYDYSRAGAYFLTIVAQDRACLFGEVSDGEMRLNAVGLMVHQEWTNLPNRFPNIDLDAFIVMPNHIHGIIFITDVDPVGAGLVPAQRDNTVITSGATTRVAPTVVGHDDAAITSADDPVGAGLVPARPDGAAPAGATVGAPTRGAPTVGNIVGAYKSITTVRYIHGVKHGDWLPFRGRLWQRNYYEHVIRDEASLNRIRAYIVNNPLQWALDRENPVGAGSVGAGSEPAPTKTPKSSEDDPWRL